MVDMFDALQALTPKAQWIYHSEEGETSPVYSRLQWLDQVQTQPTENAINAWIASYVPPPTLEDQIAALQAQVASLLAAQGK